MLLGGLDFDEVWLVDFEFQASPGNRPIPVCLVAWELETGRKLRASGRRSFRSLEQLPTPLVPKLCLSPTTPAQSSAATSRLTGPSLSTFWIFMLSSET
jgi:hypothetical protein